jgi:hypothetical protein
VFLANLPRDVFQRDAWDTSIHFVERFANRRHRFLEFLLIPPPVLDQFLWRFVPSTIGDLVREKDLKRFSVGRRGGGHRPFSLCFRVALWCGRIKPETGNRHRQKKPPADAGGLRWIYLTAGKDAYPT